MTYNQLIINMLGDSRETKSLYKKFFSSRKSCYTPYLDLQYTHLVPRYERLHLLKVVSIITYTWIEHDIQGIRLGLGSEYHPH